MVAPELEPFWGSAAAERLSNCPASALNEMKMMMATAASAESAM